jgi:hypothetical protein
MRILAFGHKSRTGKDTATKLLIDYLKRSNPELRVERRAFADKVKDISYQLYKYHGLQPREYYDENPEARAIKLPTIDMDPVEIWVAVGNKLREVYSETWVDLILLDCSADLIIISDLRYPNEAKRIHQLGGMCVRIDKADAAIRNTVADKALNGYSEWDRVFSNNSTKDDLQGKLAKLIHELNWDIPEES